MWIALAIIGGLVALPATGLVVVGVRMSKIHLQMYDK